ncbi:MAG TPA: SDR family oxidoreductase, partial [Holophagaceae bacterium]|nr:SDR family oxidoreductase [Holophagaceae bacterium]
TILVTGASRGIGRAVAIHLASSEGARLVLLGRDREALEATAQAVRNAGGQPLPHVCDVRDLGDLRALAPRLPALDGLVAAAGIGGVTPVDGPPEVDDRFREILEVDLVGPWNTVRAFLPNLSKGGRIVLVSSVLGRFGVPGYGAYCAAKHGLLGLTKALALELMPKGIYVNAVAPGWVDTAMAAEGIEGLARALGIPPEQARRKAEAVVPVGRFFQPEEIAHGIAWLLDPANTMQVGQCLNLDGGVVQV